MDRRDENGELSFPVIEKENDHPCFECAKCCTYVAVEIDTPTTPKEYDQVVWYLYHANVEVFVDWDDAWHVLFRTRCEHLSPIGLCGVYETRPGICKDFDWRECEQRFTAEDGTPDKLAWVTAGEFLAWLEKARPRAFARYQAHVAKKHASGHERELLRVRPKSEGKAAASGARSAKSTR